MIVAAFVVLAGLGAVARAVLGRSLNRRFPSGTLLVNVTGAFALGLVHGASPAVATVVGTAGLGAYTTFSSFARDAVALLEDRAWIAAAAYVGGTVALGITAAAVGLALSP